MFNWQQKFTPLTSETPDLLRNTAQYFRKTFAPIVPEILVKELPPAPEDFKAADQLALAFEQRASAIESALNDYNNHRGKVSQGSLKGVQEASIATQSALLQVADMSLKLKVRADQEDFAKFAKTKTQEFSMKIETAQHAVMAIERQIFSQARVR